MSLLKEGIVDDDKMDNDNMSDDDVDDDRMGDGKMGDELCRFKILSCFLLKMDFSLILGCRMTERVVNIYRKRSSAHRSFYVAFDIMM